MSPRKAVGGALLAAAVVVAVAALTVLCAPVLAPFFVSAVEGEQIPWQAQAIIASGDPVSFCMDYSRELATGDRRYVLPLTAVVAAAFVTLAIFVRQISRPGRNVDGGILGDAHLVTSVREIRRKNDFWDGKGTPRTAGLAIGSSKRGYVYDSSIPHWAVVGKTGSGKSWLMVLQTLHLCMAAGWNLIVTGKDEMLELTGDKALELGYSRIVFDLKGYPGASAFNPLDLIVDFAEEGDVAEAQRTARQTAADLIPLAGEANPYFPQAARSALTACLLIVALANVPRRQKNMASVCSLVNRGTTAEGKDPSAPLKAYIRSAAVGPGHPAFAPASDFLSDGGMTTAGKNVLSTLKEALSIFNDERIRGITAESDVPIRDMVRGKTVVYLSLQEEGDPYLALTTVFLNQWWRVAQQEAARNGGRLPHETAIVGDEFGNLPAVAAMPEIATLGRSYRLHAYCFTQDLKQWTKYSKPNDQNAGRDKILGSMGGKVFLALANPDDFAYATKLAGKRTVRTQTTGTQRNGGGGGSRTGSSEGYAEHADDLIHEWEWQNRIPARDGVIAVKGGENSKPGREGIFRIPVTYASKTPAAAFFGLGNEEECDGKRIAFREKMEAEASSAKCRKPEVWEPDFPAVERKGDLPESIAEDELGAWD